MSFTHIKNKKKINMVDITKKKASKRIAEARAQIRFSKQTFEKVVLDNSPKGEIFNPDGNVAPVTVAFWAI